jgi:hypothetical protein
MSFPSPRRSNRSVLKGSVLTGCLALALGATTLVLAAPGALAQSQNFLLSPGNRGKVGPSTTVTPENCVTAADGAITCDTKLQNPPDNTPAKPQFNPFSQ